MAQHFTMHADFGFCRQKDEKHTEGELENDIPLKSVHVVCMNCLNVCIAKVYTYSNQKSHQECSKQLTTGYHFYLLN